MKAGTHVVITGANRGIGLAMAKRAKAFGAVVTGLCRNGNDELNAVADIVIDGIDVSKPDTLAKLHESLGDTPIDILINNAGILREESLSDLNYETMTEQFMVNALGPLRITEALLPNLRKGSKVAMITSRMGSIADNGSGGYYGYRMSKAALNAGSVSLAKDLHGQGIALAILHPGFVQTDMVNNAGDISADTAADRLLERIEDLTLNNTGSFWHSNGEALPW